MNAGAEHHQPLPVGVHTAAWHLPHRALAVAALPELAELDAAEAQACTGLGIDMVRADDSLDAHGLAERAARDALDQSGLDPASLGALIIVESRAPEHLIASDATRLQHALGATEALTFTVGGLGCVSIAPALLTARGLLAADPGLDHVLVAHGSKPAAQARYRHPVTVNGDGGQALLLTRPGPADRITVRDVVQLTNGRYWDLFRLPYRDLPSAQWREECRDPADYSFRLAMENRRRLGTLLDTLLARNGLSRADIRGYASQNLSEGGFTFTEECLDVELVKTCRGNLRTLGHLGPNDIFLNLYTALESGELADGDRAVLINVSPVAAWSLLLVEIGPQGD